MCKESPRAMFPEYLNTTELADILRVGANTIRRSLCVSGNYLGMTPKKLGNNRSLWLVADVKRLLEVE